MLAALKGTQHIITAPFLVFVSSAHVMLMLSQLEEETQIQDQDFLNQVNRIYEMIQKTNLYVKHVLNNCVVVCSPFVGIMILFLVIQVPFFLSIAYGSIIFNFVGMVLFALFCAGCVSHVSKGVMLRMHSIQVKLISSRKQSLVLSQETGSDAEGT